MANSRLYAIKAVNDMTTSVIAEAENINYGSFDTGSELTIYIIIKQNKHPQTYIQMYLPLAMRS